jgi:hypothetical protein
MTSVDTFLEQQGGTPLGLGNRQLESSAAKTLVFDLDELRVADILSPDLRSDYSDGAPSGGAGLPALPPMFSISTA